MLFYESYPIEIHDDENMSSGRVGFTSRVDSGVYWTCMICRVSN
jgi:hypothetical protein